MTRGDDSEQAFAKLNLMLKIIGRRADGFHDLLSWFCFVDLADTLTVQPAEQMSLTLTGPQAAAIDATGVDNLVLQAASRLQTLAGSARPGAALTLTKRIPVAAGMGGGSADAAATLRLLNRFWRLGLSCDDLLPVAKAIGADVAACLRQEAHLAGGRGDIYHQALPVPPLPVLLVNPGRPLSTAQVFHAYASAAGAVPTRQEDGPITSLADARRIGNDLAAPAMRLMPALLPVLQQLMREPGVQVAQVTGSGPTLFAVFETTDQCDAAQANVLSLAPGWWTQSTRLK